jgi:hypothetical protein
MLVADFLQNARPSVRASVTRALEHGYLARNDRLPQWLLLDAGSGGEASRYWRSRSDSPNIPLGLRTYVHEIVDLPSGVGSR